jgi:hypothetical protein
LALWRLTIRNPIQFVYHLTILMITLYYFNSLSFHFFKINLFWRLIYLIKLREQTTLLLKTIKLDCKGNKEEELNKIRRVIE